MFNRKSPRANRYDYSSKWCYFITIVTKDREHCFWNIIDGKMILNELGKQTHYCRGQMSTFHPYVEIDKFICMPNHIHGILHIVGTDYIRPQRTQPTCNNQHDLDACNVDACNASLQQCRWWSLWSIIRGFKIGVTKYANANNIPFARQSRYHDHIIRNESDYNHITYYIQTTPSNRKKDTLQ